MPSNGNSIKLGAVVVIFLGVFYFIGNNMIKNNDERIMADQKLEEKFLCLKETSNECLHKIDLRLSRIENKLGINERE
jgi:hypothetical protein